MSPTHQIDDPVTAGPVPSTIDHAGDLITVARAWPRARRDDAEVVLAEGPDQQGRIRAIELRLVPADGLGWRIARTRVAPYGMDPKLPDLATVADGGTVIVHRYGKRAVVRLADRFVKVVRPDDGPAIAAAARQGQQIAARAGFDAPEVLESSRGAASFSVLPGRSLHELGGVVTHQQWSRWWQRWADQWVTLARGTGAEGWLGRSHADDLPDDLVRDDLPRHTAHDEVVNLRRWLDRVARLEALPTELSQLVTTRAAQVTSNLVTQEPQELVISHRDLHDKQLLADGDSLGVLDFDTVALAEPALDLANLWVHALLRVDQGLWSRSHGEVVQQAVRTVARELEVTPERFATYAEATRLRLACLYAFRPRHRRLALAWAAG